MRSSRFYINPDDYKIPAPGEKMELPTAVAHHLAQVLRATVATPVILFDGNGGEYLASVQALSKKKVTVQVEQHNKVDRESLIKTVLVQAVVIGAKMDMLIQKAVELGVTRIVPVISERCQVQLKGKRAATRQQHWSSIIESACEQCGRTRLPVLEKIVPLFPWAAELNAGANSEVNGELAKLVLQPDAEYRLGAIKKPEHGVLIVIGPEGGFSEHEIAKLENAKFTSVQLGGRVLRTETAGPAALAAIQTLWGDF